MCVWQTKARDIVYKNMASSRTYLNFELNHRFSFSREFWHQYISQTLLANAKELAYMIVDSLAVIHYVRYHRDVLQTGAITQDV